MTCSAAVPTAPPDLPPRYRPIERVGAGGVGEVWRAEDANLDRPLAVKVLRSDRRGDAAAAARLDREATLTGSLQHPGVPPVVERGRTADGGPFFAMKLVGGRTLRDLLKDAALAATEGSAASGSPDALPSVAANRDLPGLLDVFRDVCETLAYAHAAGVIHRDPKPANVMVGAFGEVQVMDRGLARRLDRPDPDVAADESTVLADVQAVLRGEVGSGSPGPLSDTGSGGRGETLTAAGQALGTVGYMAPEQARGDRAAVDERSDVFGLGAILCVLLTGEAPFVGTVVERFRAAHAGDLSDAFARLDGCGADAELVALCRTCLSPAAADRPADAGAVSARLAAYRDGVRERLRRAEIDRAAAEVRVAEERKRGRVWLGTAGLAGLFLLALGGAGWWYAADRAERRAADKVAATERRSAAERTAADVNDLLTRIADLRDGSKFDAAEALLASAGRRITPTARASLRAEVQEAGSLLGTARRLEQVREDKFTPRGPAYFSDDAVGPHGTYANAFVEAGFRPLDDPPEAAGTAIAASPVRHLLILALDDWALTETNDAVQSRLLQVARVADPDPLADRLRDPAVRKDLDQLLALAGEIDPAKASPAALLGLFKLIDTQW